MQHTSISKGNILFSLLECLDLVHPSIIEDSVKAGYLVWKTTSSLNLSQEVQAEAVSATLLSILGTIKERSPNTISLYICYSENLLHTIDILKQHEELSQYTSWYEKESSSELTLKDIIPNTLKLVDYLKKIDIQSITNLDSLDVAEKLKPHFLQILEDPHVRSDLSDPFLEQILYNSVQWTPTLFDLDSFEQFTFFLMQLLNVKKPATAIHSYVTGEVASLLAQAHALDSRQSRLIKYSGYVQHLGKIGFPSHLLEKGAPLSQHEKALLHNSPYFTFKILKHIETYKEVIIWASFDHRGSESQTKKKTSIEIDLLRIADLYVSLRSTSLEKNTAIDEVLRQLQEKANGLISDDLIHLLKRNLGKVEALRESAQTKAEKVLFAKKQIAI